jgi:hypothetical protein
MNAKMTKIAWINLIMIMVLVSALCTFSFACGGKGTESTKTTLTTGAKVDLATQTVSTSGGVIEIDKPGDPLDGLRIEVPSGSYSGSKTFNISYTPVTGHELGENFNPISPLISIDNGGGYSDEIVLVTIPVEIPEGKFAMGFFYDKDTGTLEGIPIVEEDSTHITIATRHFSDVVVSLIDNVVLSADIKSGFLPGVDDWQFTNHGSYIASGHCSGQSLTAMWYYCEKTLNKAPHLYGLYDNNGGTKTPDLWEDDSLGYRLASIVHKDSEVFYNAVLFKIGLHISENHMLAYRAFAYAILLTEEPQYVGIYTLDFSGGHAMVVYGVGNNTLYIADPNYPGRPDRQIKLVDGKFTPYNSGDNFDAIQQGEGEEYPWIYYFAKTALIDWAQIGKRWGELEDKSILKTIGNYFPAYKLIYTDEKGESQELKDGHVSTSKLIAIRFTGNFPNKGIEVYKDGKQLDFDANGNCELEQGNNLLGVVILGKVDKLKYIDFKYVNVVYEPKETPQPTPTAKMSPTVSPTASPVAGGGWYLDGQPVIEKEQFVNNEWYFNQSLDVTSSSASGAVTWSDGYSCGGTYTGSMTWTPPPDYMQPGGVINFSMTSATQVQNTCGSLSIGSGGWIKAEGTTIVKALDESAPSASGTYTVPNGSAGQTLNMWTTGGVANLHFTVYYNYVYK